MKKINNIELFKNYLKEKFPDKEYEIINGEIFINSKEKINILHKKCGNIIRMSSHDFKVNHNCPVCSKIEKDLKKKNQLGVKKVKRTKNDFINDTLRNNKNFIISNLENVINGESFVKIRCKICGRETEQKIKYAVKGCSCMSCSRKISLEEIKNRIYGHFPEYYRISYENFNNGKIIIHCEKCDKVVNKNIHEILQVKSICHCINEEKFIEKVNKLYNGEFEYVSGYKTIRSNVVIRHLKCDKTIHIRASHFLYDGCRCTRCKPYKNEERIKEFLESKNISYIPQKTFDECKYKQKLLFDFYIPLWNLLIEYDGEGHFRPIFTSEEEFKIAKIRDSEKNKFAVNNKINIIRIPYWRQNEIEDILASVQDIFNNNKKSYEEIQKILESYKDSNEFNTKDSYEF